MVEELGHILTQQVRSFTLLMRRFCHFYDIPQTKLQDIFSQRILKLSTTFETASSETQLVRLSPSMHWLHTGANPPIDFKYPPLEYHAFGALVFQVITALRIGMSSISQVRFF